MSVCLDLTNLGTDEEPVIQVALRGCVLLYNHHEVKPMLNVWNEFRAETAEKILQIIVTCFFDSVIDGLQSFKS